MSDQRKPIFIIRLPKTMSDADAAKYANQVFEHTEVNKDYHLFLFRSEEFSEMDFKLLSDRDIEPATIEELKEKCKELFKE